VREGPPGHRTGSGPAGGAPARLVTGGTGFVGGHFLFWASRRPGALLALVRGEDPEACRMRLRARLDACALSYDLPVSGEDWDDRVAVVVGDMARPGCGQSATSLASLREVGIAEFWHFGASLDFEERNRTQILAQNVEGTRHALELATEVGASRFIYVSTAYTVGAQPGVVGEEFHRTDAPFNNLYEESKCVAEHIVAEWCPARGMDFRILRPSIIVGPHQTLRTGGSRTGLYGMLRTLYGLREAFRALGHPYSVLGDPEARLNFVPVDSVVRDCLHLIDSDFEGGPIYHLTGDGAVDAETALGVVGHYAGVPDIRVARRTMSARTPAERLLDGETAFYASYLQNGYAFQRSLPQEPHLDSADLEFLCLHGLRELRAESPDGVFRASPVRSADGRRFNLYTGGAEGQPTVLLANACGMAPDFWLPLARRLADEFRVVTWDVRGLPGIAAPFEPLRCGVSAHVADALAALQAVGALSAYVVGWHTGAQVALGLASLAPGRVSGLVLAGGDYVLPGPATRTPLAANCEPVLAQVARSIRYAEICHRLLRGEDNPRLREPWQPPTGGAAPTTPPGDAAAAVEALQALRAALSDDDPLLRWMGSLPFRSPEALYRFANLLVQARSGGPATVAVPTLALCGGRDPLAHPGATRELARRLPEAEARVFERGDRYLLHKDQEAIRAVHRFLRTLVASALPPAHAASLAAQGAQ
jgi:nucleoside-diphosphate-sugar epimerase/pimeloyl-ACP methyl ester carboxylesterase